MAMPKSNHGLWPYHAFIHCYVAHGVTILPDDTFNLVALGFGQNGNRGIHSSHADKGFPLHGHMRPVLETKRKSKLASSTVNHKQEWPSGIFLCQDVVFHR